MLQCQYACRPNQDHQFFARRRPPLKNLKALAARYHDGNVSALRGGGVLYTSDEGDLKRLQRHFPTVLVLAV